MTRMNASVLRDWTLHCGTSTFPAWSGHGHDWEPSTVVEVDTPSNLLLTIRRDSPGKPYRRRRASRWTEGRQSFAGPWQRAATCTRSETRRTSSRLALAVKYWPAAKPGVTKWAQGSGSSCGFAGAPCHRFCPRAMRALPRLRRAAVDADPNGFALRDLSSQPALIRAAGGTRAAWPVAYA